MDRPAGHHRPRDPARAEHDLRARGHRSEHGADSHAPAPGDDRGHDPAAAGQTGAGEARRTCRRSSAGSARSGRTRCTSSPRATRCRSRHRPPPADRAWRACVGPDRAGTRRARGGMSTPDSGLTAALLQITQFAERIGSLDAARLRNFRHVETTLAGDEHRGYDLRARRGPGEAARITRRRRVVALLRGPGGRASCRRTTTAGLGTSPARPVHWWTVNDRGRRTRPSRTWPPGSSRSTGPITATWRPCWAPAGPNTRCAWFSLDWLSELHSVLYFQPKRTASLLSAQAEYGTRILPAIVRAIPRRDVAAAPTAQAAANGSAWRGAR